MVTDELRELDREWAELAWRKGLGDYFNQSATTDPAACFGPGGPWEWLVANRLFPAVAQEFDGRYGCLAGKEGYESRDYTEVMGSTIFEAIARCAIEARRKLEART